MARQVDKIKAPVVIVFKKSQRANAKNHLKVFKTKTLDEVLVTDKIPGIPDIDLIQAIGVGEVFIEKYKKEFNI